MEFGTEIFSKLLKNSDENFRKKEKKKSSFGKREIQKQSFFGWPLAIRILIYVNINLFPNQQKKIDANAKCKKSWVLWHFCLFTFKHQVLFVHATSIDASSVWGNKFMFLLPGIISQVCCNVYAMLEVLTRFQFSYSNNFGECVSRVSVHIANHIDRHFRENER